MHAEERERFAALYQRRLAKVRPEIDAVFALCELPEPPVIVGSAFFWIAGLNTSTVPADYSDNPQAMMSLVHLSEIDRSFHLRLHALPQPALPPRIASRPLSPQAGHSVAFLARTRSVSGWQV